MRQQLREEIPDRRVDILCLPVGWTQPNYADGLLARHFGDIAKDPNLLENIQSTMLAL